ncbi:tyramine receptor Ser-2-like [Actinia tenebrosa]|uniref:Tyramine receptor Ser-2-like n=1 Tax=Actinia tenebrosa TaxID=6105 RepID=A0A6P8J010_ACTTE|nr:tyramine receptor Ser-2-like [Actinia tenebrosa]XP_031571321.1 tyramine receptor Ser-2-like [Actinia tenebrosa]XP_031571322.1 tyramine receptor Ser-2-like [Actinia tenebrosa]
MMANATNGTGTHILNFEKWYGYMFAGLYCIIIIVATLANIIVCCAIGFNRKLRRNPTYLFILSLAFSDLVTAVFAMPFDAEILITAGKWHHDEALCKAWIVAYLLTVPTSINTLLALSVDRYKTLSDPLNRFRRSRFMTRKRAIIIIIFLWAYCFIVAILPVADVFSTLPFIYEESCLFPLPILFSAITSFTNFVIPLLLTCAIYIKIYQIARLHPLQQQRICSSTFGRPKIHKEYMHNIRAAKTISLFVFVFVFCWVPYSTVSIIGNLCESCFFSIPPHVYPPLLLLGYLNSALNPFLFSFRNRAVKNTLCGIYDCLRIRKSVSAISRSLNSIAKRSELPDNESSTVVRMFSMRSFSGSRSETSPEPNQNETYPKDLQKTDSIASTSRSREPLSCNDKLQLQVELLESSCPQGREKQSYGEYNTHL